MGKRVENRDHQQPCGLERRKERTKHIQTRTNRRNSGICRWELHFERVEKGIRNKKPGDPGGLPLGARETKRIHGNKENAADWREFYDGEPN